MRIYLISGLFAGVAAIVMIARFNSAKADYGESYLLMTVFASALEGISASGSFGLVSGLVIALIILQFVSGSLNLLEDGQRENAFGLGWTDFGGSFGSLSG